MTGTDKTTGFNANSQWRNNAANSDPIYGKQCNDPHSGQPGMVWQPWALGGGEWRTPLVLTLSDTDVDRIARAVVRMMKEQTP